MRCLARLLALLAIVVGASRLVDAGDAKPSACRISGETILDGKPVAASVEVRLQIENPQFPHAFHWTSDETLRRLAAPRLHEAPAATVSSDEHGAFEARGLSPGRYWVVARTPSGAWAGVHVPLHAENQHTRVTLQLLAGTESLGGRLQRADGKPFRGLVVASRGRLSDLDREDVEAASERWAETDEWGRYRLEGLARGPVILSALEPGRLLTPIGSLDLPAAGDFDDTVDEKSAPTKGRVVDVESGAPVQGASVIWSAWTGWGFAGGSEPTAEDGSYSLPSPIPVYRVHVRKPGYAERFLEGLEGVGNGTIRVRRGSKITGRVTRSDGGAPVAGLLVERRGPGSYWYQWTRAVTDADGRFAMEDQAPGSGAIYARGAGWAPAGLRIADPWGDDAPRVSPFVFTVEPRGALDVALRVTPAAAIDGRVETADGHPVAGVPVIVEDSEDPAFSWDGHGVPPVAASGDDGAFRIDGLLRSVSYKLRAKPIDGAPLVVSTIARDRDAPPEPAVFRLPVPHWIVVRVVNSKTRQPVPRARVEIMIESRRDDRSWRTDDAGVARVGPIGEFAGSVDVEAAGYIDANQRQVPTATTSGASVTIAIDPALTIEGRVQWKDGKPAADATVFVADVSDDIWKTYRGKKACDADGQFIAEEVNDIDYRVAAVAWRGKERFAATTTAHGGARNVVLTLTPQAEPEQRPPEKLRPRDPPEEKPVAARLTVVDPDGKPVARAQVAGSRAGVVDGVAEFEEIPAGPITIYNAADDDGIALAVAPLTLERWPREAKVTLPRGRAIEGRVVDGDGNAVSRVEIRAVDDSGGSGFSDSSPHGSVTGQAVSRADGTFSIGGLTAQTYILTLTLLVEWLAPVNRLTASPGTPVRVQVRRAFTAEIVVADPDGKPLADATVTAEREGWHYFWREGWSRRSLVWAKETTDRDGKASLGGLDPLREYALAISPPDGRDDVSGEKREEWRPSSVSVTLPPRSVIKGTIVGAGGSPAWEIHQFWRQDGEWHREFKGSPTFELDLPVRGEVELLAGPIGLRGALPTSRVVRARGGDEGVTVHFEPGATLRVRGGDVPVTSVGTITWAVVEEGVTSDESRAPHRQKTDDVGKTVEFDGLDPAARYTVLAVQGPGGLCGRADSVVPRADAVVVALKPGKTTRVTVQGLGRRSGIRVRGRPDAGGPWLDAEDDDGSLLLRGLVAGRWRVRATGILDDDDARAETVVEAGDAATLVLERH